MPPHGELEGTGNHRMNPQELIKQLGPDELEGMPDNSVTRFEDALENISTWEALLTFIQGAPDLIHGKNSNSIIEKMEKWAVLEKLTAIKKADTKNERDLLINDLPGEFLRTKVRGLLL